MIDWTRSLVSDGQLWSTDQQSSPCGSEENHGHAVIIGQASSRMTCAINSEERGHPSKELPLLFCPFLVLVLISLMGKWSYTV